MKDRILQIMRMKKMSQQEFAKAIEVSPASLSNIFNGRTNPTNNHVSAIHNHFPDININWLMFGEGDMYVSDKPSALDNADTTDNVSSTPSGTVEDEGLLFPEYGSLRSGDVSSCSSVHAGNQETKQAEMSVPVVREIVKYIDKPQRRITEIRIFFDDGTYEVFGGN